MTVPLIDVLAHRQVIGTQIDDNIARVVNEGKWIMGPQCQEFETELTDWIGNDSVQSIGCANGTDALVLAIQTLGLEPGQGVVVPSFTFVATAECVVGLGGIPIFADVDPNTFNMTGESARRAATAAQAVGVEVVGIVAVDLFGQPAPYAEIRSLADELGCWVVADAAQSFGASQNGQRVGTLADVTTTSFFPAKPLGCYGDGGAVFTGREDLADTLRSLRVHGKGTHKYDNVYAGHNSRLDTMQAAILLPKLAILGDELAARDQIAARYAEELGALADDVGLTVPQLAEGNTSAWAQYTLRFGGRDDLQEELASAGIGHAIYYPKALHQQTAYQGFDRFGVNLENSEALTAQVISIPMYPYLSADDQSQVIDVIKKAVTR